MSTRARDWARFCLLAMGAACLGAEEKGADPVIGGVYAARELSEDSWTSREAAWPMAGLRVDDGRLGTLLVKYTVGAEQNGDADFRYESDCDCYRSKEDLRFAILGDSGNDTVSRTKKSFSSSGPVNWTCGTSRTTRREAPTYSE